MNYARLEDRMPAADRVATDILGHEITITIGSTPYVVNAQGSYEDGTIATQTSTGFRQEIELMVLKADLPTRPVGSHRVVSSKRPGEIFSPVNVRDDETGQHWLFNLKKVAA